MQRNIKTLIVVPENNTTMEPEIFAEAHYLKGS